jgi:hypothetical protein
MAEKRFHARVEESLLSEVKTIAKRKHMSVNAVIVTLLEGYVKAQHNGNGSGEGPEYVSPPDDTRLGKLRASRDARQHEGGAHHE